MNGKEIIDLATAIVNRQEANTRTDILAFINSARMNALRSLKINRLQQYKPVSVTGGVIDMETERIKSIRAVDYVTPTTTASLPTIFSRKDANDIYKDFATTGTPSGYLVEGTAIYILPVPTEGTVKVSGEFWPADLTDSTASSDITTVELGDAWAYLGAGLYLEAKGEPKKAQEWQQKGASIVEAYNAQDNKRLADTADVWRRWPFGRPLIGRRPATTSDLERGNW